MPRYASPLRDLTGECCRWCGTDRVVYASTPPAHDGRRYLTCGRRCATGVWLDERRPVDALADTDDEIEGVG